MRCVGVGVGVELWWMQQQQQPAVSYCSSSHPPYIAQSHDDNTILRKYS